MSGLAISAYERKSVLPDKWLKIIDRIVYSDAYMLAIAALVVLFWATEAMVAGFVTLLLIMSFLLVVKRDMTPCLPILISVYCVISKGQFPSYFAYMFIILVPVAGSLIFHFVYYRTAEIKGGAFGFAYLFVAASMFMGGIMSNQLNDELKGLAFAAFLGLVPFAVYELIVNCCNGLKKTEFVSYVSRAFLFLGVLITAQLLIYYIRVWTGKLPEGVEVHLGWGISNGAATVLLATMPISMYVAVSEKKLWKSVLIALLSIAQFVAVIATVSRGAILVGAAEFVLMMIASVVFNKHRKAYVLAYVAIAVLAIVCCVLMKDRLIAFIERAFNNGLDDSGRDNLYKEAIDVFKQNKLFGVGFGYIGLNSYLNSHPMYYFHSTVFQTLASLGLFGTAASIVMYYKRVKFAFAKGRAFNIFLIVSCFGFEGYAMINTFTFLAVPGLLIIAVLTATNERCNSISDEEYASCGAPLIFASKSDNEKDRRVDAVIFGSGNTEETAVAQSEVESRDEDKEEKTVVSKEGSISEMAVSEEISENVENIKEVAATVKGSDRKGKRATVTERRK